MLNQQTDLPGWPACLGGAAVYYLAALLSACGGGGEATDNASAVTTSTTKEAPAVQLMASTGGGGGGGGGGTTAPPPVLSGAASAEALTGYAANFGVVARSTTSEIPTITFNSGPVGMTLLYQSSYGNKYGFTPYATYSVQWTPTREQIGASHSMSFTATTRAGSTTLVIPITAKDAPSPVTGLTATASAAAQRITAHWDSTIGGIGPVSHTVTACFVIPRNPALAATRGNVAVRRCEVVGSSNTDQLVFSTTSQPLPDPTVYPFGATYAYDYVYVDVVGADGVAGTTGMAAVTLAP